MTNCEISLRIGTINVVFISSSTKINALIAFITKSDLDVVCMQKCNNAKRVIENVSDYDLITKLDEMQRATAITVRNEI